MAEASEGNRRPEAAVHGARFYGTTVMTTR